MEIPKFIKGVAKYFTYASDSGETTPTTQADLQELMKNNNTILECLVDGLWQPEKEMQLNQIIRSPNMPANMVAKVTAVGTTGTIEPEWSETVDETISDGSVTFTMLSQQQEVKKTTIIDLIYPVGSIYISTRETSPNTIFGGTWKALEQGRVLLSQGENYAAGSTGGEATHTLTENEMAPHKHDASATSSNVNGSITVGRLQNAGSSGAFSHTNQSNAYCGNTDWGGSITTFNLNSSFAPNISINSTGGGAAHNNMQPYLAVYMWKRTA